jgi:hypothetical protein
MRFYRIDRSTAVWTVIPIETVDDRELARRLARRVRCGQLCQWGGVVRERIDARTYNKPFAFYVEQQPLFK